MGKSPRKWKYRLKNKRGKAERLRKAAQHHLTNWNCRREQRKEGGGDYQTNISKPFLQLKNMNFPVDGAHPVPGPVAEGSLIPCESLRCFTGGKEKPGMFSERQNWSLEEVETQSGIDFVTATPRARGKGQDSQPHF